MKRLNWKIFAFASYAILYMASAQAQATRTWVSGVGDDVNPCSRTAPCKTFAGTISKTAAGGEINVLDPGDFGAVTITKSISIISDHFEAGVLVSGNNGIVVNTLSTDRVVLQGLDFEGLGTGLSGVKVIGGGKITIRNCSIRNFTQYGVDLEGTANARVVIESVQILGNTLGGLLVQGAAGATNNAIVDRTLLDSDGTSVKIAGPGTVFVSESLLEGAAAALDVSGGGIVTSYGNNVIRGAGAPTTTLPRT
jgi:hypothetical protein